MNEPGVPKIYVVWQPIPTTFVFDSLPAKDDMSLSGLTSLVVEKMVKGFFGIVAEMDDESLSLLSKTSWGRDMPASMPAAFLLRVHIAHPVLSVDK